MDSIPDKCPECQSENIYEESELYICPDCNHEWVPADGNESGGDSSQQVLDANGNVLSDGDTVSVMKSLKVKGSNSGLKAGTKVKNIKLIESSDGHNISCKIDGFGAMYLKSEFVKKA